MSHHAAPKIHRQLAVPALLEESLRRREGQLADNGAFAVRTGKYTGRSPGDKFIVDNAASHDNVDWGKVNQPFAQDAFDALAARVQAYMNERDPFTFDGFAGADPRYRRHVRVITEHAWHTLFIHQLLIEPQSEEEIADEPDFTIIDAAGFKADPTRDGTKSETFIIADFERRLVLIGGTEYAGEIKKSVFTLMNFVLPKSDVLPMHCSASAAADGSSTLFFGLSGTGKTTLSADPERALVGDDEHGWSEQGVFNIEGGCYAKCIHLSREHEPQIYDAIKFGTVLENVVLNPKTRAPLYDNAELTENTRAAYPLKFIDNAVIPSIAGHPKAVIFLTADAFGVLPPIARLTEDQAMYHFLSGYTAKLAGTERGVTEPQATFSTCFAQPFLPLRPEVYAQMLGERLKRHNTPCYLINTGWSGGPYEVGKRIDLAYTRAMVRAAISGALDSIPSTPHPHFQIAVPQTCPDVPSSILNPRASWADARAYDIQAQNLAALFQENFKRFASASATVRAAGILW